MGGKAYGSATLKFIGSDYLKQNILSKYPNVKEAIKSGLDDENQIFDFNYLAKTCSGGLDSISKHAGKLNSARGMQK